MSTPTNSNADGLYEILEQLVYYPYAQFTDEQNNDQINKAMQLIDNIRLPVAKVVEAIGEDEQFTRAEADGKTEDITINIAYYRKSTRNWLREQIKRKLGLESE